jgi:hypothetical protein
VKVELEQDVIAESGEIAKVAEIRNWPDSFLKSVDIIVLLASVGFMIWLVRPDLVFSSSTLTGGDYGGHFEVPWFWAHYMLPNFQIRGFSPDWYDGYPFLVFYFPIPALVVGTLGLIINYSVAFKLLIALSLVALPLCLYFFGTMTKLPSPIPSMLSIGAISYLFNYSYTIDGGNIFSTMAGEYSFEIALDLTLIYLGLVYKGINSGKFFKTRVVLLALILGCHVVVGFYAIGATVALYLLTLRRYFFIDLRNLVRLLCMGLIGVGLLGFWWLPFYAFKGYMTDMGYSKIRFYMINLFPHTVNWAIYCAFAGLIACFVLKKSFLQASVWCLVTGVAACIAVALSYSNVVVVIVLFSVFLGSILLINYQWQWMLFSLIAVVSAALFVGGPNESLVYNGRYLPFWFLAVFTMASLGLGNFTVLLHNAISAVFGYKIWASYIKATVGALMRYGYMAIVLVITAASVVNLPWIFSNLSKEVGSNSAEGWIIYNFSGYQGKTDYKEFKSIMSMMNDVGKKYGCGRAMWEYSPELSYLGTTMALMLLPYYTNECIDSEEGLFFESSATTPFHFLNQAELSSAPDYAMNSLPYGPLDVFLGVKHLELLGVKYFLADSPAVQKMADLDPNLRLIDHTGPWYLGNELVTWKVYEVKNSSYVVGLKYDPNVLVKMHKPLAYNLSPWTSTVLGWYGNSRDFATELVASGLKNWPHIKSPLNLKKVPVAPAKISNVKVSTEMISFNTDKLNVPVLIKVSYFPNWHVKGALGPFRAAPNLVVVVPTSHKVTLYWGPTIYDDLGKVISGLSLIVLIMLAFKKPARVYKLLTSSE